MNSLLVLLVIAFFALTNFFRGDVELTFSFLLVLRLAVYYAKNVSSEQSLFLEARPFDSLGTSLDAGFLSVVVFRRHTRLIEGPTLQYVCRRVYIFK